MAIVDLAQPDITLTLDLDGIIQDTASSNAIPADALQPWRGRPWIDTVGEVAAGQVRHMLEEARSGGVSAFRQVTQNFPSGLALPVEYTTIRLGGEAGLVAVGRSLHAVIEQQAELLAAQRISEQRHWRLRDIGMPAFPRAEPAAEIVLVVDARTLRLVRADAAAQSALGLEAGADLLLAVPAADRPLLRSRLLLASEQGRAPAIRLRIGAGSQAWMARLSRLATEPGALCLLRLSSAETDSDEAFTPLIAQPFEALFERLPDALLMLDPGGLVRRANPAFLDLAQLATEGAATGRRIAEWLGETGEALLVYLRRHGVVRSFPASLIGDFGAAAAVEISAAGDAHPRPTQIALVVRDVGRRPAETAPNCATATFPDPGGLVGKTPLQDLVRDAVDAVERRCIEAALATARGNRTAAAAMLRLSRQTLYTKMNRYGLERESTEAAD